MNTSNYILQYVEGKAPFKGKATMHVHTVVTLFYNPLFYDHLDHYKAHPFQTPNAILCTSKP